MLATVLPQWATVSASMKPGMVSSHWFVLMGICFFMIEPGFVIAGPFLVNFARDGAINRSMVLGDIFKSFCLISFERIYFL